MTKKKNQNKDFEEFSQNPNSPVEEESIDEEEESEEKEGEDVYAEDEGDKEMMRKLELEDRRIALEYFSFDEEVGFNPAFDWSTVSEADRNHFVAWMSADASEVEAISWKRMNAFQRWIVARAASVHCLHAMFREITQSIIKVKKAPAELLMEDIYLELLWDYLETHEVDEAVHVLELFEKSFPQEEDISMRVRGLIHAYCGDTVDAKTDFYDLLRIPFNRHISGHEDDKSDVGNRNGVIKYEIGYALLNMKCYEQALYYFNQAYNLAVANDDHELMMAIHDARSLTEKAMNGDEA